MASRRRRPRRSRRASKRGRSSGLWILLGVLVLAGFIAFVAQIVVNEPPVLLANGCPAGPIQGRTSVSVLFDTTDKWETAQRDLVAQRILNRVNIANDLDRVRVYVVDPTDEESLSPIFDYCKPQKDSGQVGVIDQFLSARFRSFLVDAMSDLDFDRPASPIIQSLASVAANFPSDGSSKEIILVSDLIEYSSVLNQYDPNWQTTYRNNPRAVEDRAPKLADTDMLILFVTRPKVTTQNKDLVVWWENFLLRNGVGKLTNIRITG